VLPVRLFVVRTFSVATAGTLLFGAAFFAMILANVLFLTSVWDYSVLRTAVAVLPSPLLAAVTAPLAGRLADRHGFRVVVVPGALSMVAAQAWFATRTTADASYVTDFLPGSVLAGLAIGFAFSALGAAGAQALPPASFAVARRVGATARHSARCWGWAVLVAVWGEPAPAELLAAFHRSWTAIGVAAVGCAAVCWPSTARGSRRPEAQPTPQRDAAATPGGDGPRRCVELGRSPMPRTRAGRRRDRRRGSQPGWSRSIWRIRSRVRPR
jgi:MFS family permease